MTDQVLEALVKGGASADIIEMYVQRKHSNTESNIEKSQVTKPKRKLSEKQLAALAAGRAKNPRLIAKQKKQVAEGEELQDNAEK